MVGHSWQLINKLPPISEFDIHLKFIKSGLKLELEIWKTGYNHDSPRKSYKDKTN